MFILSPRETLSANSSNASQFRTQIASLGLPS